MPELARPIVRPSPRVADAVVPHAPVQGSPVLADVDLQARRPGVAPRVGNGLPNDPIRDVLHGEGITADLHDDVRREVRPAGRPIDQIGERARQAVGLEQRRVQLEGKPPHPLDRIGKHRARRREHLGDPLCVVRADGGRDAVDRDEGGGDHLDGVVVKLHRDPLALGLLRAEQLVQRSAAVSDETFHVRRHAGEQPPAQGQGSAAGQRERRDPDDG